MSSDAEHPGRVSLRPLGLRADEGDSGWLLWRGDESRRAVTKTGDFEWMTLGWLTDLFPKLEPVFRAGEGDWRWNPGAGEYEQTDS